LQEFKSKDARFRLIGLIRLSGAFHCEFIYSRNL
jgi:hypothetical protein